MSRRQLLLTLAVALGAIVIAGGLVALLLRPPPVACWMELRYALEPATKPESEATAAIVRRRLRETGYQPVSVWIEDGELLARVPIREQRVPSSLPDKKAAKLRKELLDRETAHVSEMVVTGAKLSFHTVDACDGPARQYAYAHHPAIWQQALAGESVDGPSGCSPTPWSAPAGPPRPPPNSRGRYPSSGSRAIAGPSANGPGG